MLKCCTVMATASVKGLITEMILWPASSDINTSREREGDREISKYTKTLMSSSHWAQESLIDSSSVTSTDAIRFHTRSHDSTKAHQSLLHINQSNPDTHLHD